MNQNILKPLPDNIRPMLKKLVPKLHFIAALGMFLFIAFMVVENDQTARVFLLVPIVICYMVSKVLFAMDQANMVQDIVERQKK
jgi:hypothetical protein